MLGPPMIPLVLSTLFSAGFAISMRFAQKRGADPTAVGAVNYLTAALIHAVAASAAGLRVPQGASLAIGIGGGLVYAAAFFLMQAFMSRRGVSVTGAVTRLSVLVPVGVSLLAWGETANGLQTAGGALAVVSLPLLSLGPREGRPRTTGPRPSRTTGLLLAGLFVMNGLCLLAPRAFRQTGIEGEDALFLLIVFATAALAACGVWLLRARGGAAPAPILLAGVLPGLAVGLCNALANRFVLAALKQLPGILVYPFYSAAGLLVTVAFSRVVWKERIGRLEAAGMALALGSIVLVNLG